MSEREDTFAQLNKWSQETEERKLLVEKLMRKSFSELNVQEREMIFRYMSRSQAHQWIFSLEMDELIKLFNFFVGKKKIIPSEIKIIEFLINRTPTRNVLAEFALKVHKYKYDIRIMALQLAVKNKYIDLVEEIALNEYKSPGIVITAINNIENPEVLTKIACGQIKLKKPPLNVKSDVRIQAIFRLRYFENLNDTYYYTIAKESNCKSARIIAVNYIKYVETLEKLLKDVPLDSKAASMRKLIKSDFEELLTLEDVKEVYSALLQAKITFGKYKDKTIEYVMNKDISYLNWVEDWAEENLPWYHDFILYIKIFNTLAEFILKHEELLN